MEPHCNKKASASERIYENEAALSLLPKLTAHQNSQTVGVQGYLVTYLRGMETHMEEVEGTALSFTPTPSVPSE